MNRPSMNWVSALLGLLAVALAVALTYQSMSKWKPAHVELRDAGPMTTSLDGGLVMALDLDAGFEPIVPREPRDGGAGFTMLDGTPVPFLPQGAPRAVRFGVVLVTYAGAEDAPRTARPKHDALDLARKLAAQAKDDFHAAVKHGDDGSNDDVGTMKRGVIEPAPEFVLFSLEPGGVSEPIDTPRGYWIVKRIE
jgi:PPIC-type peptidyl-prolyl cis-trans isomerase-like protein